MESGLSNLEEENTFLRGRCQDFEQLAARQRGEHDDLMVKVGRGGVQCLSSTTVTLQYNDLLLNFNALESSTRVPVPSDSLPATTKVETTTEEPRVRRITVDEGGTEFRISRVEESNVEEPESPPESDEIGRMSLRRRLVELLSSVTSSSEEDSILATRLEHILTTAESDGDSPSSCVMSCEETSKVAEQGEYTTGPRLLKLLVQALSAYVANSRPNDKDRMMLR